MSKSFKCILLRESLVYRDFKDTCMIKKGGICMSVNATTSNTYGAYNTTSVEASKDTAEKVSTEAKKTTEEKETSEAVVFEKTSEDTKKGTYSINRMSKEERSALVDKLKADQEARQKQLADLVHQMMSKQAGTFGVANNDKDAIWKFLASGDYTVDAETKAQAQKDIAEDGYYGVKQTSQRLFDFASALAGDDVEKMKKMQDAMLKGFQQATKSWGKELPGICKDTLNAANKLFDDYYASKETVETAVQ